MKRKIKLLLEGRAYGDIVLEFVESERAAGGRNRLLFVLKVFNPLMSFPSLKQDVAKQLRDQQMVMKGHRDDAIVHVSFEIFIYACWSI